MLEKYTFVQPDHTDLRLVSCGFEDCRPGHRWGPGVREHIVVHVILQGQGTYACAGQAFPLGPGQGFVVMPGELVEYEADQADPWSYIWIGFTGLRAESLLRQAGLSARQPLFRTSRITEHRNRIDQLLQLARQPHSHDLHHLAHLYAFIADLIDEQAKLDLTERDTQQQVYLRQAIRYIAGHYTQPVNIHAVAAHVGLDRSYLYVLFRRHLQQTPKDFLTTYRIGRAIFLLQTALTIGEVARSVGFEDAQVFAKVFKRSKGMTPTQYRQRLQCGNAADLTVLAPQQNQPERAAL
jgi:AraC-like DNA-binding protein